MKTNQLDQRSHRAVDEQRVNSLETAFYRVQTCPDRLERVDAKTNVCTPKSCASECNWLHAREFSCIKIYSSYFNKEKHAQNVPAVLALFASSGEEQTESINGRDRSSDATPGRLPELIYFPAAERGRKALRDTTERRKERRAPQRAPRPPGRVGFPLC